MQASYRAGLGVLLSVLAAACSGPAPVPLFESRVDAAPYFEKLQASGGDPARILRPRSLRDLKPLESEKRYKFVVVADGSLAIAPLPIEAPDNEYVHPVLAGGGPVRTAGSIALQREGEAVLRVTLDQDSKAYCPTSASLAEGFAALVDLGVSSALLRIDNRPTACVGAEAAPAGKPRYGALMVEVGARFETLGGAVAARRWELAEFERGEIDELLAEDLPRADAPREVMSVDLNDLAQAFRESQLAELKTSLVAKDSAAAARSYALAAETCNGCHLASGHGFIEIPEELGKGIPKLDPFP